MSVRDVDGVALGDGGTGKIRVEAGTLTGETGTLDGEDRIVAI